MPRIRCDNCGDVFNSKMNYESHQKYAQCEQQEEQEQPDDRNEFRDLTEQEFPIEGASGYVLEYDDDKGYGFVETADVTVPGRRGESKTTKVFIHISDVRSHNAMSERKSALEKGYRLEFNVVDGEKGLRATEAIVVERNREREKAENTRPIGKRFGQQKDLP